VDNSVAVFGGALAYTRPGFGKKSGMDPIQGSSLIQFSTHTTDNLLYVDLNPFDSC
jgi:hypothetical protein